MSTRDQDFLFHGMKGQPHPDARIDLGFPERVGVRQDSHHVSKPMRDLRDLVTAQPLLLRRDVRALETLLSRCLAIEFFLHPSRDERRIGARLKGRPMLGELPIAFGDLPACPSECMSLRRDQILRGRQSVEGPVEIVWREQPAEPAVQPRDDPVLSQIDVAGMHDAIGQRVLLGEAAAVVGRVVDPLALHPAVADPAVQQSPELVRLRGAFAGLVGVPVAAPRQRRLHGVEVALGHDRRVDDCLRPHPLMLGVPPEFRGVAEADIVDVDEDLVLALAVPHLMAGVAGVGQDGPYRALGPGDAGAVAVPARVVS
ncbi:hypothetical protein OUY24_04235 [Nonomuraea ferruginea]|uniref:Uncharacterized protein n=1 Tax=Nonomuraea ferruginea TaxID=46174 RepID=A0ABT4SRC7_9ACTN|nr:hypothetical protein [Nonomuraea ferruginea]MDA0639818.1 hypothetical protein [Nonomuraea ferruginea]